jgi:uncharacterized membrane protein YgdD (TMEM256/DUF423 family)
MTLPYPSAGLVLVLSLALGAVSSSHTPASACSRVRYPLAMHTLWLPIGAVAMALAVAGGAFAAHGLKARLDAHHLALWETAVRYLAIAGVGLLATGLAAAAHAGRAWGVPGWMLLAGGLVFSGTVAVLALGGPRWLGAVTPIGGLLLIAGFVALAVVWLRRC